uniref:Uncharacterized protein n=1 Tax=Steinernema glaseri TaxID=37863 RepID=A0A1I7YQQ5_9BILA
MTSNTCRADHKPSNSFRPAVFIIIGNSTSPTNTSQKSTPFCLSVEALSPRGGMWFFATVRFCIIHSPFVASTYFCFPRGPSLLVMEAF